VPFAPQIDVLPEGAISAAWHVRKYPVKLQLSLRIWEAKRFIDDDDDDDDAQLRHSVERYRQTKRLR